MTLRPTRRAFLRRAASAGAFLAAVPALAQGAAGHVVVIGGGFAGASCARALKILNPHIAVTLVEPKAVFTACPFSNEVVAGLRELREQQFGYDGFSAAGIVLAKQAAAVIEPQARNIGLADGSRLAYDRLIIAPGIDLRWDALPGYNEATAERMPHAWARRPNCCATSCRRWRMGGSSSSPPRRTRIGARPAPTSAPA